MILSQFFYLDGSDETGKIYAGPVWDYDLTMGNPIAIPENGVEMFFANKPGVHGSSWSAALYEKEDFLAIVKAEYETVFRPLLQQLLDSGISQYSALVKTAAGINGIRWPGTYTIEETGRMQDYMQQRMAFLDSLWLEEKDFCIVQANAYDGAVLCYAVEPGNTLPEMEPYEDTLTAVFYGWYYADTDEPVDYDRPVTENTSVYLKYDRIAPPVVEEEEPLTMLRLSPAILILLVLTVLMTVSIHRNRLWTVDDAARRKQRIQ